MIFALKRWLWTSNDQQLIPTVLAVTTPTNDQPAVTAGLLLCIWLWAQPSGAQKVAQSDIWSDQIRQGDLAMQVDGYGKLKSKLQRLLSAPTNATVDEIVLKPGALVNAQSVILRLTNPDIEQQLKDAYRELVNRKTLYRQLELVVDEVGTRIGQNQMNLRVSVQQNDSTDVRSRLYLTDTLFPALIGNLLATS
ncbi:MAG: multidrug efflux pump subunit AcrA (membrane-fusion protein) [Phenylobacterium sp.]|jgi:multidrug efflux pump subunit AcrA (membrane-fusion protein)